jgi:hypothetical protein
MGSHPSWPPQAGHPQLATPRANHFLLKMFLMPVVDLNFVSKQEEEIRDCWTKNAGKIIGNYYEMSSLIENKIEKFSNDDMITKIFLQYNETQLSRIYPKGIATKFPCALYSLTFVHLPLIFKYFSYSSLQIYFPTHLLTGFSTRWTRWYLKIKSFCFQSIPSRAPPMFYALRVVKPFLPAGR